jgi:hypothetical protein
MVLQCCLIQLQQAWALVKATNDARNKSHVHVCKDLGGQLSMLTNPIRPIRKVYRDLLAYAANEGQRAEVRSSFKRPLGYGETVQSRLKAAEDRLSFLRISSVKPFRKARGSNASGKWIYKDGQRLENVSGTIRDAMGRVVSSYDGANLDPESVSRHQKSLKRAGFVNNLHAKGFF